MANMNIRRTLELECPKMSNAALYVFVTISLLASTNANATELSGELEAIIEAVAAAHEVEIRSIRQGRGLAHVRASEEIEGKPKDEVNYRVDFCFKGIKTRSDLFLQAGEASVKPHHVMAFSGETALRYNCFANGALIKHPQDSAFRHEVGEDFHPQVFFSVYEKEIAKLLEAFARRDADKVRVHIEENGVLKISKKFSRDVIYHGVSSSGEATAYVVLDPNRGYRALEVYIDEVGFQGPGSRDFVHVRIQWADYSKATYPKEVSYKAITKSPDRGPESNRTIEKKIVIEKFHPDVKVNDEEFTLAGMGLKPGTRIDDEILGILYTYGTTKVDEGILETLMTREGTTQDSEGSSERKVISKVQKKPRKGGHYPQAKNDLSERNTDGTNQALNNSVIPAIAIKITITIIALVAIGGCSFLVYRRKCK
jgi:hypothetical protein